MRIPYGGETAALIRRLNEDGIDKMSLILRHSKRDYHKDVHMEPFMCLTDEGRDLAFNLGTGLPENLSLKLFSSHIGRCIETAYLIDKGFVKKTGGYTEHNRVAKPAAPFYVRDIGKIVDIVRKTDVSVFIRQWIDGGIPEDILMNAKEAADRMVRFLAGGLWDSHPNTLHVSVSHDWNLYLLKEFGLGLPHEAYGKIAYLEGVVLFEKGGETYIANHQKDPTPISFPL
jgi:hypothetical protein